MSILDQQMGDETQKSHLKVCTVNTKIYTWSITDYCSQCIAAGPFVEQCWSTTWFSDCVKESAVVLFCSRAPTSGFCWLMASHEPAPVLLPSLWEGGRERVMVPGGKRHTEAQREKEGKKTEVRIGRELAGWKEERSSYELSKKEVDKGKKGEGDKDCGVRHGVRWSRALQPVRLLLMDGLFSRRCWTTGPKNLTFIHSNAVMCAFLLTKRYRK